MALPSTEELAALGVEITPPTLSAIPERVEFEESSLEDEPNTDRKIILETGRVLRERVQQTSTEYEGVRTTASRVAPTGVTLTISHAVLDEDDKVATDVNGSYLIAPAHEILLIGEHMRRLGPEGVQGAIDAIRQEAAAKADAHFYGMELINEALSGRS